MTNTQRIIDFVNDQLNRADARAKGYAFDVSTGKQRAKRNAFVLLEKFLTDFSRQLNSQDRWLTISGLRGTGKTTLLAQLYRDLKVDKQRKLFISTDHIVQLLGSNLAEVIETYEYMLGTSFEKLSEPVFLFIDEVQYDTKWALTLKSIYDRSPRVFIISTGSSALEINSNPDTARRIITETLLPMSFTEYQKISKGVFEEKGLGSALRQAIRNARSAQDIYDIFKNKQSVINRYWTKVDRLEINKYLQHGTLPFMAAAGNPALAFDQLERSIDRILGLDVSRIGKFDSDTLAVIPQALYNLADSDAISLNSLSKSLSITRPTLTNILAALEQAEVLFKLSPQGSHTKQNRRQSAKYLFTTPAIRAMYFTLTGSTRANEQVLGHLLEDAVGLYLRRIFGERSLTSSINYGSDKGSADFAVKYLQNTYAIEVGMGKKTSRQIQAVAGEKDKVIGIVVSRDELNLDTENNIATIPIRQFLLA